MLMCQCWFDVYVDVVVYQCDGGVIVDVGDGECVVVGYMVFGVIYVLLMFYYVQFVVKCVMCEVEYDVVD